MIENVGGEEAELVGATNAGAYVEGTLGSWLSRAPRYPLAANLGVQVANLPDFQDQVFAAASLR